jgi:hypothetical protein
MLNVINITTTVTYHGFVNWNASFRVFIFFLKGVFHIMPLVIYLKPGEVVFLFIENKMKSKQSRSELP